MLISIGTGTSESEAFGTFGLVKWCKNEAKGKGVVSQMKVGAALGTWELPERLQEWTRALWAPVVGPHRK